MGVFLWGAWGGGVYRYYSISRLQVEGLFGDARLWAWIAVFGRGKCRMHTMAPPRGNNIQIFRTYHLTYVKYDVYCD